MNRPDDIYHKDNVPALVRRGSHRTHRKKRSSHRPMHSSKSVHTGDSLDNYARSSRARTGEHPGRYTRKLLISVLCVIVLVYLAFLVASLRKGDNAESETQPPPVPVKVRGGIAQVNGTDEEDVAAIVRLMKGDSQVNQDLLKVYTYLDDGKLADAQIKLEQSRKLCPDNLAVKKAGAEIHAGLKEYNEARDLLFEVLEATPEDMEARLALTKVLVAQHRNNAVMAMTEWILLAQPYSIEARHAAAIAALNLNIPQEAVMHLRKILEIDSQYQPAKNLLGVAFRRQGAYDKAIELLTEQLAGDDGDSVVYYNLAICYAARNQAEESVEWLSQAVDMFGTPFVQAWLKSEEFDVVRTNPTFIAFATRLHKRNSAQ